MQFALKSEAEDGRGTFFGGLDFRDFRLYHATVVGINGRQIGDGALRASQVVFMYNVNVV